MKTQQTCLSFGLYPLEWRLISSSRSSDRSLVLVELTNDRLIKALLRQPVDRTPVWMMRQAGRYLPEYRALRQQVPDFMTFCKTPDLAVEVTLQPLARFALDAAIIFSDILTIPDAMGMQLEFVVGEGPVIHNPVRTERDVKTLTRPDVSRELDYVMQAISQCQQALVGKVPLIGFAGSPWTLATYMVEGGSSKFFAVIKGMLYREPTLLHKLLDKLAIVTIDYLNAQIAAGANAIMIFDTWGGVLTPATYKEFSLHYMQKIAEQLQREHEGQRIPVVFFTKNAAPWLETIAHSGCDAMGVDWTVDIGEVRERIGDKVALQGNLDPMTLFGAPESVRAEVQRILQNFGPHPGHVFNLGHGIHKDTPIESVTAMVDAVHEFGVMR